MRCVPTPILRAIVHLTTAAGKSPFPQSPRTCCPSQPPGALALESPWREGTVVIEAAFAAYSGGWSRLHRHVRGRVRDDIVPSPPQPGLWLEWMPLTVWGQSRMATRVDSWIWAIRFTKTRSAAAPLAGPDMFRVNSATAKPATTVAIGDEVRSVSVTANGSSRSPN